MASCEIQEGLGNKMGHQCCRKQKVKRGLWSPEEDEKLIRYITIHGHSSWSSVPNLAGLDPNTHNLLAAYNHKHNHYNNACKPSYHSHQQPTSTFTVVNSQRISDISSTDMKAPLIPFPMIPLATDNNPPYPPLSHEFSSILTYEYQNPKTQAFLESTASQSLIGSVPILSSTSHPSEFGMFDESFMWAGGYGPIQSMIPEKKQAEQQVEIEKITSELTSVGQNMDASFETSNFDFAESTMLPCGMYYNQSSIDQLAWDSWALQERK
ncbi:hypothetical protein SADUNF_Sadunf01G0055500 [Salix dunnii]|uniref:Uncharacterized protein n=1 Tax=Salix dunnii TaxID=1413687 RepID=A0A835NAM7_9ROSI|nr:hypothetical protein SADUNF_Sadunf01G0055500 [Salix dunnii]